MDYYGDYCEYDDDQIPSHKKKNPNKRIAVIFLIIILLTAVLAACYFIVGFGKRSESADSGAGSCTHVWVNASCTTPKTCSVCGFIDNSLIRETHEWETNPETSTRTCILCGITYGVPKAQLELPTGAPIYSVGKEAVYTKRFSPEIYVNEHTLTFHSPVYSFSEPVYSVLKNALNETISTEHYDLKALDGDVQFTFSNNLPNGVYRLSFYDNPSDTVLLYVTFGHRYDTHLFSYSPIRDRNLYLSSHHIQSYKYGRYLTRSNNTMLTTKLRPDSYPFIDDKSEFIFLLTPMLCEASGHASIDPDKIYLSTYDPAACITISYEGWFFASNEAGRVYITDTFTDDCYWTYATD